MAFDLVARIRVKDDFSKKFDGVTKRARKLDDTTKKLSTNFNKFSGRSSEAANRVKGFGRNVGSVIGTVTGLATAIGGVALAYKGLQSTIGEASNLEQQMISMEHFMGLTRSTEEATSAAQDYVAYLRENANLTPFGTGEVIEAGRRSLQVSGGDIEQAKNMLKIAEDMVALNPGKTLSDGMEALADLAVGETERMKEFGFKISADDLKEAGGAFEVMNNDVAKMFEGGAQKLANSSAGIMSTITGGIQSGLADAGVEALERLKPQLESISEWLSAGGADGIFQALSDGLAFAVEKAIAFAKVLPSIIDKVKEFTSSVKDNWPQIRETVLGLVTSLVALKAALAISGVIGKAVTSFKKYQAVTKGATVASWALNTAILANPITWIVAGIAAVVVALVLLVRNVEWVGDIFSATWAFMKSSFTAVTEWLKPYVQMAMQFVMNVFTTVKNYIAQVMPMIIQIIQTAWSIIGPLFTHHLAIIWQAVQYAFNMIWSIVKFVFDTITNVIQTAWTIISGIFKTALQLLTGDFSGAWETMKETAATAIDNLKQLFGDWIKGAVDIGKNFVQGIIDGFLAIWDSLKKTATKIWDSITSIFDKKKTVNVDVNANTNTSPSKKVGNQNYHGDPYVAKSGWRYVHQGERIMTAQENSESKQGKGAGPIMITGNQFTVREEADIEKIANSLALKILRDAEAGA